MIASHSTTACSIPKNAAIRVSFLARLRENAEKTRELVRDVSKVIDSDEKIQTRIPNGRRNTIAIEAFYEAKGVLAVETTLTRPTGPVAGHRYKIMSNGAVLKDNKVQNGSHAEANALLRYVLQASKRQ